MPFNDANAYSNYICVHSNFLQAKALGCELCLLMHSMCVLSKLGFWSMSCAS